MDKRTVLTSPGLLVTAASDRHLGLRTTAMVTERPGRHTTAADGRSGFAFAPPHRFTTQPTPRPDSHRVPARIR
jgi:hypothetical protein